MNLLKRIETTRAYLEDASDRLLTIDMTVAAPLASVTERIKRDVRDAYKHFLIRHIDNIFEEVGLMEKSADLFIQRAILSLRYGRQIWPDQWMDESVFPSSAIDAEFNGNIEEVHQLARTGYDFSSAAMQYDELAFDSSQKALDGITRYESEASRLQMIKISILAGKDSRVFKGYTPSRQPRQAYARQTQKLANVFAERSDVIALSMDLAIERLNFMLGRAARVFPDNIQSLRSDAQDLAAKAHARYADATHLIDRALTFYNESKGLDPKLVP